MQGTSGALAGHADGRDVREGAATNGRGLQWYTCGLYVFPQQSRCPRVLKVLVAVHCKLDKGSGRRRPIWKECVCGIAVPPRPLCNTPPTSLSGAAEYPTTPRDPTEESQYQRSRLTRSPGTRVFRSGHHTDVLRPKIAWNNATAQGSCCPGWGEEKVDCFTIGGHFHGSPTPSA